MLYPIMAENGMLMVMWIGMQFPPELVMKVFGVPSLAQVNTEMVCLTSERKMGYVGMGNVL